MRQRTEVGPIAPVWGRQQSSYLVAQAGQSSGPVSSSESAPIDWVALRGWYLSTTEVLTIFDLCCIISRTLLKGGAAANLREAERLGALTAEADRWLSAHPCPGLWNGNWVRLVNLHFVAIKDVVAAVDGLGVADDEAFRGRIDDACARVVEIRELVVRVGEGRSL